MVLRLSDNFQETWSVQDRKYSGRSVLLTAEILNDVSKFLTCFDDWDFSKYYFQGYK